jgi:hypothetical protein
LSAHGVPCKLQLVCHRGGTKKAHTCAIVLVALTDSWLWGFISLDTGLCSRHTATAVKLFLSFVSKQGLEMCNHSRDMSTGNQ